jgi:hypothetical protein
MGRRFGVLCCAALVLVGPAAAAKNPQRAYLEKTLKKSMVATFKKKAPSLKLTTVACRLPSNGTVAHCTVNFTVPGVNGYYPVTAKLLQNGVLKWTAAKPKCKNAKTGKAIPC